MIEILLVVVIIAIAAMLVVPMFSSADSMQLRSAANMLAADLEYAKSMAITRGQNFSVEFDEAADSYSIKDQNGVVIAHPVKKGFSYVVNLQDERLAQVDIVDADFDPDSQSTITFDNLGSPYSGTGVNPLNSGVITLQTKGTGAAISVEIEPVTGFISLSD
jgi:Tfp pilus assembly protein FimT